MKKERFLKVIQRFRNNEFKLMEYPEIRLAGNWLKKAGFNPQDKIGVIIKNEKLVIVKCLK